MIRRVRYAFWLSLLLSALTSLTVFAKGSFSFILISGANLKNAIRVTAPALTDDFFAFATFYEAKIEPPTDAGRGYEITRYYMDHNREVAFDRLHYYPNTGYVYYDGIVGGWSEYDGKWYAAKPEMKTLFENALLVHSIDKPGPFTGATRLMNIRLINLHAIQ